MSTYYSVLSSLVNKHAPLVLLKPCSRSTVPWFNRDISNAIRERRRCERIWRRTRCESDRSHFVTQRNYVQLLIRRAKLSHYSNFVSNSTCNAKSVWPAIRSLLCRKKSPILPSHVSKSDLPSAFAEHFHVKISSIRDNLLPSCMERIGGTNCTEKTCLSQFSDVTVTETESVMLSMKPTSCSLDPAPTWLVKMLISDLAPIFAVLLIFPFNLVSFQIRKKELLLLLSLTRVDFVRTVLSTTVPFLLCHSCRNLLRGLLPDE